MVSGLKLVLVGALVGTLHFGCSSDEDEDEDDENRKICKTLCEFSNECGDVGEDCSKLDTCMDDVEELSGSCRSALEDFTDCLDEHPDCSSSECEAPARTFLAECEDEL